MKHRATIVAAGIVVSVVAAGAQERIVLPRGPSPDQTVRSRTTQDMSITLEPAEAGGAIPTMVMAMKSVIAQTMTVGPLDANRRYEAGVSIDDATVEMTMNGAPMPMPG